LIALEHLSMQFGGKFLFRDVTATIRPGDRMGLVGPNGAGKTTLLRIIAGVYEAESGSVNMPTGYEIGYLPQEPTLDSAAQSRTLIAEAMRAREDLIDIEEALAEVQLAMEDPGQDHASDDYLKVIERFGTLHHQFEDLGGFELESDAKKILAGLGFRESDFVKTLATFSGGWQMRLMLAKLLIARNDALLLDEPTNHLDLESMLWLENFLKAFEGTIIMVSHDRAFLNLVCNRTAEIENGKIEVYPGNYEYYERTKAEREAQLVAASANIEARRKELESFVARFRYSATKARQAQSRVKMLERMERIELSSHGKSVHFSFPAAPPSGRMVFEIEEGAKSYDGIRDIFSGVDLRIERGDRVAFLGRNGEGKTTMGKIFAGQELLTGGALTYGHNVTLGYYAQHQAEALKPELTVLETLESVTRAQLFHGQNTGTSSKSAPRSMAQIRTLLGAFLFQGDDVFKPVRVLSGGEKSRLALAKMLLEPVNTLILDEPTNHLDVQSKEVVKEALLQFEGTIIVISHDRDFLEDLTDRLITFGDGHVKEYPKPIEIYLEELRSSEIASIRAKRAAPTVPKQEPKEKKQVPIATNHNEEQRKRIEAEERNKKYKQEKPIRDKISRLEKQIEKLEKEKLVIEDGMYDPGYYSDAERVKLNAARLAEIKSNLDGLMFEWAGMSEKLGSLTA
jgi:ATP-binding cassette, subfamily F, member 3